MGIPVQSPFSDTQRHGMLLSSEPQVSRKSNQPKDAGVPMANSNHHQQDTSAGHQLTAGIRDQKLQKPPRKPWKPLQMVRCLLSMHSMHMFKIRWSVSKNLANSTDVFSHGLLLHQYLLIPKHFTNVAMDIVVFTRVHPVFTLSLLVVFHTFPYNMMSIFPSKKKRYIKNPQNSC